MALTRRALDLTRFQMARLLGTDMPTWGTYEAGLVRIPVDQNLSKRLGSRYRSGRSPDWLKFKNLDAPAVKREAEEDWR